MDKRNDLRPKQVATNATALLITGIIAEIIRYSVIAYSAQQFGPQSIGAYFWAANLIGFLALIARPGIAIIGERNIARDHTLTTKTASLVLTLHVIFGATAFLIAAGIAAASPIGPAGSSVLLVLGVLLVVEVVNVGWVLQAHQRMVAIAVFALLVDAGQLCLIAFLIHSQDDLLVLPWVMVAAAAVKVAFQIAYLAFLRIVRLRDLRPTLVGAPLLLSESWPIALSIGAALVYYYADTMILGLFWPNSELGLYTSAYSLMLFMMVPAQALTRAFFPVLARAYKEAPEEAKNIAARFVQLQTWMGCLLTALVFVYGEHLFIAMFGPDFADGVIYLKLLSLNLFFIFVNIGLSVPMTAWGFQRLHLIATASSAALNVVLNLIFIPNWGVLAAIITTLFSEFVVLVIVSIIRKRRGIGWTPVLPIVLPPLITGLLLSTGLLQINASSPTQTLVGWSVLGVVGLIALYYAQRGYKVLRRGSEGKRLFET